MHLQGLVLKFGLLRQKNAAMFSFIPTTGLGFL
jgi:hypothetical protein